MYSETSVIDYARGMATAMGNKALYHALLLRFKEHQNDFSERLERVLHDGDIATAIRYTHSLKGLAGNIGAKLLQQNAMKLEYALDHDAPYEHIELHRVQTSVALRDVLKELELLVLEPMAHTIVEERSDEETERLLERLKEELKACDANACETMTLLMQKSNGKLLDARLPMIAKTVYNYHYEEALSQLEHTPLKEGLPMKTKESWLQTEHPKRYKILVIDDLADNIALITNILKEEYDITVATSAALGLELAQKEPKVDLILLDIVMPTMDGYRVCEQLKEHSFTREIPVIFLTVLDETADVEKGFLVGGVDYVTKPFEPNVLKARVKAHCELSYQRLELKRFNQSLEKVVLERTKELEQTQLYIERLAKQAALGDVIGMIAHQWRQPVAVISMIANNVLLDIALDKVNPESIQEEMNNIAKQTQFLSQTIDNFRNFFKPSGAKQEIVSHSFFESLRSLMSAILSHYAIELRIDTREVETLYVYKNELLQVMVNLINNAKDAIVEHHVEKGVIELKASMQEGEIVIEVNDNGGGMDEASMSRLAEPYFSTKNEKNGTGLGLYMSRVIAQKHLGGRLEWANRNDGASFRLFIPKFLP